MILYFYPAAMTPGCTKQACDFRDNLGQLTAEGFVVLGVSKDKPAKLAKFAERDALTFPLLSDPELAVHQAYGAYGTKKLYGKEVVGVIRSHLRHRRRRQDRAGPLQREGHRPRGRPEEEARPGLIPGCGPARRARNTGSAAQSER